MNASGLFRLERAGQTAIVAPQVNLRGLESEATQADLDEVLDFVGQTPTKNAVIDCSDIEHIDSTGMGFFVRVWKVVSERGGQLAFCNVSAQERTKIEWCKLDELWKIHGSLAEALAELETADPRRSFPQGSGK